MATAEELRRAREDTSIFSGLFDYVRENERELAAEGRRPVLGGLLSKEPVVGADTIRYEGVVPMLAGLLEPLARGFDAPRAAAQGFIPREDMLSEAFGTAGTVMGGTAAAAGRGVFDYDPTTTRIFAGRRAAARSGEGRRAAIAEAQNLFDQGLKNREVYERTGVFRGADGKLRFEIDDRAATVTDAPLSDTTMRLEDYLTHPELYELYPSMRGMPVDFKRPEDMQGARGSFSPSSQRIKLAMDNPEQMRSTLLHEAQHAVQNREGFSGGSTVADGYSKMQARDFADNLFTSPQAQNQYYNFQSFNNLYDQVRPLYRIDYHNKLDNIVDKGRKGTVKPRDVFGLQDWYKYGHLITSDLGTMPKKPGPERDSWLAMAANQLKKYDIDSFSMSEEFNYNEALRRYDNPNDVKNAIRRFERKIEKHRDGAFKYRGLQSRANEIKNLDLIDAYLREAGEVEARNVQARAKSDGPQSFPLDTAEFSPEQQIISSLRAGETLVDVSSQGQKPIGLLVLEQQAGSKKDLGDLFKSQGMNINDLGAANLSEIESVLDVAARRGILDPRSAFNLKRGLLD